MSSFEEEGFLSSDADKIKADLILKNQEIYNFAKEINIFCYKIRSSISVDNSEGREVISACLYIKMFKFSTSWRKC